MNEPICNHCGGGPSSEEHERECAEDTVLYQQQSRIVDLKRQLAAAQLKLKAVQRAVDAASDSGQYSLALVEIAALLDLACILKEQ